jgi:hypothetical protein
MDSVAVHIEQAEAVLLSYCLAVHRLAVALAGLAERMNILRAVVQMMIAAALLTVVRIVHTWVAAFVLVVLPSLVAGHIPAAA